MDSVLHPKNTSINLGEETALYLRKSRKDLELEKAQKELGTAKENEDTLTRHRAMLLEFAEKNSLVVTEIYPEVVSGESIVTRPEMVRLLEDIEMGKYDSVLCMDIDRLGRGSMQEQGIILETLKKANVRIITPRKVYDLNDEMDEEYSEFEAFMARKELKIIKRRLRRGIERSVDEGCLMGPTPYGYEKVRVNNRPTMQPHPEHADVVRMIFDMYVNQNMGGQQIANKLNELGYKTLKGKEWVPPRIRNLLRNPVYSGKVVWKRRLEVISKEGVKTTKTNPKEEWVIRDGLHEALVSEEIFEKAQEILKNRYNSVPVFDGKLKNPLAGILVCKTCGYVMQIQHRNNRISHYHCAHHCGNKSSQMNFVEDKVIQLLETYFSEMELKYSNPLEANSTALNNADIYKKQLDKIKQDLSELNIQKGKLHDLLEQGVYDIDTFLSRSKDIAVRAKKLEQEKAAIKKELTQTKKSDMVVDIPKAINTLKLYSMAKDVNEKNRLLKSIVEKIEYSKSKSQKLDEFELTLYPRF